MQYKRYYILLHLLPYNIIQIIEVLLYEVVCWKVLALFTFGLYIFLPIHILFYILYKIYILFIY